MLGARTKFYQTFSFPKTDANLTCSQLGYTQTRKKALPFVQIIICQSVLVHAKILLLFVLPSWLLVFSKANHEIRLGSSLIASDSSSSWRSPSGEFAFGFHQLGDHNLLLLAIRFEKIPEKTLAWYANGDKPAPEGSKVELTSDGQFILNDPKGVEIWRPQTFLNGFTHALTLDTGNFALVINEGKNQNSTIVWESFKVLQTPSCQPKCWKLVVQCLLAQPKSCAQHF